MPGYEDYKRGRFQLPFHQPSTLLGHFDASLDPITSTLTIVVRMAFSYQKMYYSLAFPDSHEVPGGHDVLLIQKFKQAAERMIPEVWNERFAFELNKSGWPKLSIKTVFQVAPGDLHNAHYHVELSDPSKDWNNQAVVTEGSRNEARPHFACFSADVTGPSGATNKMEQMVEDLVGGYDIPLPNYQATLARETHRAQLLDSLLETEDESPIWGKSDHVKWRKEKGVQLQKIPQAGEVDEQRGIQVLTAFAKNLDLLPENLKFYRILVQLFAPINRYGSLIEYIYRYIPPRYRNIMDIKHNFQGIQSEKRSISIALRSSEVHGESRSGHTAQIMSRIMRTRMVENRGFQQLTICHEFGHMLGLPDEYICLTHQSKDLLNGLELSQAKSPFSVSKWLELQSPVTGIKRDNPVTSANQSAFLELCGRAKTPAPLFGRKSPSLMSAGGTFNECHGATLWETLCQLTAGFIEPHEWTIKLLREN